MAQTVIGIFNSESEAQSAVQQLVNDGFYRDNIDVSSNSGNYSSGDTSNNYSTSSDRSDNDDNFGDKVSRFFSNLFGDDDDNHRNYSEVAKRGSVVTVHAQSQDEAERAADILDLYGAVDVDERAKSFQSSGDNISSDRGFVASSSDADLSYGSNRISDASSDEDLSFESNRLTNEESDLSFRDRTTDSTFDRTNDLGVTNLDVDRTADMDINRTSDVNNSIPIIEESLEVGKREVETGGVRVRSRIVERPVEESLRLRSERVTVERNPVNRPASEADLNAFQEENFELTERAEIPVVNKEARVVEEVRVGKEVENREETVRDTVRKTDVDVQEFKSDENNKNWNDKL